MTADSNDDGLASPLNKLIDFIQGGSEGAGDASLDSTGDHRRQDTDHPPSEPGAEREPQDDDYESPPEQLADGRFIIERVLGEGGFGFVCLARDTTIQRQVAIKIPNQRFFRFGNSVAHFLEEAQKAAALEKHAGIVTIYDVGQEDSRPYIVMEYIQGSCLDQWAARVNPDHRSLAELLIKIADAVGVAHRARLFHRDLKPANVLVDRKGEPHVADFGLALHEKLRLEKMGEVSGTAAYMAPEQVRGETHRIDGCTDIWALGVILYELLAGRRPFSGTNRETLFREITSVTPQPLQQVDSRIPAELSRICAKCLESRSADRYPSVVDLIDDLQHWLDGTTAPPPPPTPQHKIVPKGLDSFDEHDADFFLELLPGPRDRDGLPDSLRFWKTRVEQTDPEKTFSIGLMYGPSGCGKSSLMKAGLLPRLDPDVVAIYLEATPDNTEQRLRKAIYKHMVFPPKDASLAQLCAQVREQGLSGQRKLLIVLDQFEQWLHAHGAEFQAELIQALRHCDGGRLQCVLMVRNDFLLAVNRFMRQLEVDILERRNSALVDLFDLDHAGKVLTAFGRAYGRLPAPPAELSSGQADFVSQVVKDLARDNKVISVRLALFAEMLKAKPWTAETLKQVGGTEGVGEKFLEETFSAASAPAEHIRHRGAAERVLQILLPDTGADIKGTIRSVDELLQASGYSQRPREFASLLRILNSELRLIAPIDPAEGDDGGGQAASAGEQHYQLTHDYLVPSLRRWLRQKEEETAAGRARLRLADRAALWSAKPEVQQLPKWSEYFNILALTRKRDWTDPQRRMMVAAGRYYLTRAAALAVMLIALAWGGREIYCRVTSSELARSLAAAGEDKVLEVATNLQGYLPWARTDLNQWAAQENAKTDDERKKQLHARLALVATDDTQVPPLMESLLTATNPKYVGVIRSALQPYASTVAPELWKEFHAANGAADRRFRAGMALAGYAPDDEQWSDEDYRFLVEQLVASNAEHQPIYRPLLAGIAAKCLPHLDAIFEKGDSSEVQTAAANAIAEFARDDQPRIARLLAVATPKQYEIFIDLIAKTPDEAVKANLAEQTAQLPPDDLSSVDRVPYGQRRAGAAITLLRLGEREKVLPVFEMTDDPEALTQFIHRCKDRGVGAGELLELLRFVSSSELGNQPVGR